MMEYLALIAFSLVLLSCRRASTEVWIAAFLFCFLHLISALVDFQWGALIYSNLALSVSLLLYPALSVRRDWAFLLSIILTSCIIVDLAAILNAHMYHSVIFGQAVDIFKYISTTGELVILAFMANGKLDGDRLFSRIDNSQHSFRRFFTHSHNPTSNRAI